MSKDSIIWNVERIYTLLRENPDILAGRCVFNMFIFPSEYSKMEHGKSAYVTAAFS
jgi:hypothetical protein